MSVLQEASSTVSYRHSTSAPVFGYWIFTSTRWADEFLLQTFTLWCISHLLPLTLDFKIHHAHLTSQRCTIDSEPHHQSTSWSFHCGPSDHKCNSLRHLSAMWHDFNMSTWGWNISTQSRYLNRLSRWSWDYWDHQHLFVCCSSAWTIRHASFNAILKRRNACKHFILMFYPLWTAQGLWIMVKQMNRFVG